LPVSPGDVLNLTADQIHGILEATTNEPGTKNSELNDALFAHAESVSRRFFGDKVYQRGIVEFSNVCENDCGYCGIRKYQPNVHRYSMSKEEILDVAMKAFDLKMGTLMLQSGELKTPRRLSFVNDVVREIRRKTILADLMRKNDLTEALLTNQENLQTAESIGLCVALSIGELPLEELQRLRASGASRYLVRIETSNPELFARIHPKSQTLESRVECLLNIKAAGLQLGTGLMVGLPGQTLKDLANDLVFFKNVDADMIGMGPYIPEDDTWVAEDFNHVNPGIDKKAHLESMVQLTTRMNALARITLGNVNIAATTSLQAINPLGRELALSRGANVVMPILTPTEQRAQYQLYPGKPCVSHGADGCASCLKMRIASVGKELLTDGSWSDPPHFNQKVLQ